MYREIHRLLDLIVSGMAIVVLSPLFLVVAFLIMLDSKGPIIFKQKRLGVGGVPFNMYKFRTMYEGAEKQGTGVYSYKGDSRVTRVGKILRATSIDELPQLINIIKGEMSLIGPRPALTYHPWPYDQYDKHQKHMFDVRPGITGWAQVNGRKEVPWPERIEMNIYYVEHFSFALDLRIFLMTIFKVLTNADNANVGETSHVN